MRYPVAIWAGNGAYSAEVPDLPGVITEADSISELEDMVKEAAYGWMEAELDDSRSIPDPTSVEHFSSDDVYKDCMWMLVDLDMDKISDKVERVNVCLPSRALRRLDFLASNAGTSRSSYLARPIYTMNAQI